MAPTAGTTLALAASQIGTGENPPGSNHNKYTTWYGMNGAWCYMFVSWCFGQLGALDLVHGKHAYVPDVKGVFEPHGEWHTSDPKAGDLVAFDFNRSGSPEHIGLVEKVLSASTIQTIEGNTSDHVYRRVRSRSYVYGYARPKYAAGSPNPHPWPGRYLRYVQGHPIVSGADVTFVQQRLGVHHHAVKVDGRYGPVTAAAVRAFQKDAHLSVDAVVGPNTWRALAHA